MFQCILFLKLLNPASQKGLLDAVDFDSFMQYDYTCAFIKLDYLGDICRINISNRNFKLFSNMKFKQFVVNEYVSFLNMESVRRKTKKKRCNSSSASKAFDKIFKTALNPHHIKNSLAAIRDVNAAFAGKIPQAQLNYNQFNLLRKI